MIGDGVQTTSDGCAAGCSGAVGVVICFIDIGMVVEILNCVRSIDILGLDRTVPPAY